MTILVLTKDEVTTIRWVGHRYGWSSALMKFGVGRNLLSQIDEWDIHAGIEADMEGGHDAFPCLDTRSDVGSDLADKLMSIYMGVV